VGNLGKVEVEDVDAVVLGPACGPDVAAIRPGLVSAGSRRSSGTFVAPMK